MTLPKHYNIYHALCEASFFHIISCIIKLFDSTILSNEFRRINICLLFVVSWRYLLSNHLSIK